MRRGSLPLHHLVAAVALQPVRLESNAHDMRNPDVYRHWESSRKGQAVTAMNLAGLSSGGYSVRTAWTMTRLTNSSRALSKAPPQVMRMSRSEPGGSECSKSRMLMSCDRLVSRSSTT